MAQRANWLFTCRLQDLRNKRRGIVAFEPRKLVGNGSDSREMALLFCAQEQSECPYQLEVGLCCGLSRLPLVDEEQPRVQRLGQGKGSSFAIIEAAKLWVDGYEMVMEPCLR